MEDWPQCTPAAMCAMTCDGRLVAVQQLLAGGARGVPANAIKRLPFEEYHLNPEVFATAVPEVKLRDGHPSLRFIESLDYIRRHKPDVVTMQSPVTEHTPIMHFHAEEISTGQ